MADESKYDPNQVGSGAKPQSTDAPLNDELQTLLDRADRASELHKQANRLADHSRRK
jgi:hypothetical protein